METTKVNVCLLATARLGLAAGLLGSAAAASATIYACVDANGKRLTSDRPIVECLNREQRQLNPDGSVRSVLPPAMTSDERAEAERLERQAAAERAAQQDAIRRDRNLIVRFSNEAAHRRAREAALDDVRKAVRVTEARVKLLATERKPLLDEAEFYEGKPLPAKLKQALDANDASVEAQRTLVQNQQAEVVRINTLFDVELERLRRLWAGAQPGSMGVLPKPGPASAPHKAASK